MTFARWERYVICKQRSECLNVYHCDLQPASIKTKALPSHHNHHSSPHSQTQCSAVITCLLISALCSHPATIKGVQFVVVSVCVCASIVIRFVSDFVTFWHGKQTKTQLLCIKRKVRDIITIRQWQKYHSIINWIWCR